MAKLAGKATIRVDGLTFKQEKGATLDIGGKKRNTKASSHGVAGFAEEIVQSKLEFSFFVDASTSLAQIGAWENITATVEVDTGQTYVINGGWVTEPPVFEESDGKAKIIIEGPPAEEMN